MQYCKFCLASFTWVVTSALTKNNKLKTIQNLHRDRGSRHQDKRKPGYRRASWAVKANWRGTLLISKVLVILLCYSSSSVRKESGVLMYLIKNKMMQVNNQNRIIDWFPLFPGVLQSQVQAKTSRLPFPWWLELAWPEWRHRRDSGGSRQSARPSSWQWSGPTILGGIYMAATASPLLLLLLHSVTFISSLGDGRGVTGGALHSHNKSWDFLAKDLKNTNQKSQKKFILLKPSYKIIHKCQWGRNYTDDLTQI